LSDGVGSSTLTVATGGDQGGITEAQWTTFMTIVRQDMNARGYPAPVRDEFLAVWRAFHDDVVQK
jgi:hypothetical protein